MKQFLIILALIIYSDCSSQIDKQLRYDGLYQTESNEGYRSFLRFYEGGTVIYTHSSGEVQDLISWFKKEEYNSPKDVKGIYKIRNSALSFTLSSIEGMAVYQGKIENNLHIIFNVKSFINGYQSEKDFYFFKF